MQVVGGLAPDTARLYRSPFEVFASGWRYRHLILRLARREIEGRYRGSLFGLAWSLIVPLLLLAVYTFVFSVVFESRWGTEVEGRGQFALILFSGLIVFNLFAECVNRAPALMLENVSYIKKLVFPLECFAWVTLAVAAFNMLVSTGALLIGYVLLIGPPPATILLVPPTLIPIVVLTLGLSWFLSSLGVYIRDLQQFIPVFTTVLMFMSPIFYPKERLPASFEPFVDASPLAVVIEQTRGLLFWSQMPDWLPLATHTLLAWGVAWLGYMFFCKTRKGFADVT